MEFVPQEPENVILHVKLTRKELNNLIEDIEGQIGDPWNATQEFLAGLKEL